MLAEAESINGLPMKTLNLNWSFPSLVAPSGAPLQGIYQVVQESNAESDGSFIWHQIL
jgi:hypothetical protein